MWHSNPGTIETWCAQWDKRDSHVIWEVPSRVLARRKIVRNGMLYNNWERSGFSGEQSWWRWLRKQFKNLRFWSEMSVPQNVWVLPVVHNTKIIRASASGRDEHRAINSRQRLLLVMDWAITDFVPRQEWQEVMGWYHWWNEMDLSMPQSLDAMEEVRKGIGTRSGCRKIHCT